MEMGGPVLPGTKGARGRPLPRGKHGTSSRVESVGVGGTQPRGLGAGSFRSAGGGRQARPSPGSSPEVEAGHGGGETRQLQCQGRQSKHPADVSLLGLGGVAVGQLWWWNHRGWQGWGWGLRPPPRYSQRVKATGLPSKCSLRPESWSVHPVQGHHWP